MVGDHVSIWNSGPDRFMLVHMPTTYKTSTLLYYFPYLRALNVRTLRTTHHDSVPISLHSTAGTQWLQHVGLTEVDPSVESFIGDKIE